MVTLDSERFLASITLKPMSSITMLLFQGNSYRLPFTSRANLSESYFTERQDRYILFKNCPELANFVDDFLQTMSSASYQVEENGDLNIPVNQVQVSKVKEFKKNMLHQFKMFLFANKIQGLCSLLAF